MTPRPLYRWKSFWFGGLVIAFLGWAWARSMNHRDAVYVQLVGKLWANNCVMGKFTIERSEHGRIMASDWGIRFSSEPFPGYDFPVPAALKRIGEENVFETWMIAHWFLILFFLVPWSGWLAWRWREIKRLSKPGTQC